MFPFTGMMSFPVEIDLVRSQTGGLSLRRTPIAELAQLRRMPPLILLPEAGAKASALEPGGEPLRFAGHGSPGEVVFGLELLIRVHMPTPSRLQLVLRGVEVTLSVNETGAARLGLKLAQYAQPGSMPLVRKPLGGAGLTHIELHILADRTSIEIFDSLGGASLARYAKLPCSASSGWRSDVQLQAVRPAPRHVLAEPPSIWLEMLEAFELESTLPLSRPPSSGRLPGESRQQA